MKFNLSNINEKTKTWMLIGLVVLVSCSVLAFSSIKIQRDANQVLPLTQEQLVNLTKPSIVRIIQHVQGSYKLPNLDVDLANKTVQPLLSYGPTQPLDEYISGSGSIINPDGYIVTNSHVVSSETLKSELIQEAAKNIFTEKLKGLTPEQQDQLFPDNNSAYAFASQVLNYLQKNSVFDISSEVVVLNPSSTRENIRDLVKTGFIADVTYVNDDYGRDQRDVAIIKINQTNLPAISINSNASTSIGDKIFIFGFPASADFNTSNPLESTLTQGVISASKYSDDKNFKVFQTDAKISQGSSGGPMLNSQGEIIGLVTFETGEYLRQTGDNFAFAIPVKLVQEILNKKGISNTPGEYGSHFRKALSYYTQHECKLALDEFNLTKDGNKFFINDQYIKPFIDSCRDQISQGASLDTPASLFFNRLKGISLLSWFMILGRILLIALGSAVLGILLKRIKKDEQEILELKYELGQIKNPVIDTRPEIKNVSLPLPEEGLYQLSKEGVPMPHPPLVQYIKESRLLGLPDHVTKQDLLEAGWKHEDIHLALNPPEEHKMIDTNNHD